MLIKLTSSLQESNKEIVEVVNTLDDFLALREDLSERDLLIKGKPSFMNGDAILEIEVK